MNPPRRVLMTADAVGGVMTYATDLARELARRGVTTHLAVLGPPAREAQRAAALAVAGLVLHELECALEWMDHPWDDVTRSGTWLFELERRVRPDVVHVNGFAHASVPFEAPVIAVAHSCVASWWEAVLGGAAPTRYDVYRREVWRGLSAAAAVIAPSRAMSRCLARHYDFENVFVVPNGAALPERMRPKQRFVLGSGRLGDRAKNLASLARVAPSLPWPVKLAGGGADFAGVEHLGWLPKSELGAVMAHASIYAAPALYEPFGLAALEAALRGCALVLGDIESQREIWGDAAMFVDARDDDALARAVARLAEDPTLRESMAERAWRRALAYSPARTAEATLAVYASAERGGAIRCA